MSGQARTSAITAPRAGGVVYFLRCGQTGPIKIGVATNLEKRVAELACGMPDDPVVLGTLSGSHKAETALHREFRDLRRRGEWFEATDELLSLIRSTNGCSADVALAWLRQHRGREEYAAEKVADLRSIGPLGSLDECFIAESNIDLLISARMANGRRAWGAIGQRRREGRPLLDCRRMQRGRKEVRVYVVGQVVEALQCAGFVVEFRKPVRHEYNRWLAHWLYHSERLKGELDGGET